MDSIKAQVTQGYKQKLQQYEAALTVAIHQQYPLSHEARQLLQRLQQEMNLSNDMIASIEERITAPLEAERQRNLQQYKKVFTRAIHWQYPLSHDDREFLANLRRVLDLNQEMAQSIEQQVTQGYEQKLQQYEAAFTRAIHQQYPLSDETHQQLQQLQQSLDLRPEVIDPVETQITQVYEQKLQQYETAFTSAIQRQYLLSDSDRKFLANLQQGLNLTEHQVTQAYERKLQQYEEAFTQAIHQQYPLNEEACQTLQQLQRNFKLGKETTESIEARVTQGYEQKLQQYETALTSAIQRQYPLKDGDREFLANLRRSLNLNQKITDSIEALEYLQRGLNLSENDTNSIEMKVTQTYNLRPTPTVNLLQGRKRQKKLRPLLPKAIVIAVAFVGVSILAYYAYSLWQTDKSAKAALEQAKVLKAEENYEACRNQAEAVPQQSRFYTDAQNLLNQCQRLARDQQWLAQAKGFAAKNNLKDAIAQASGIRSDSNFHPEAQQLISQWSETLLEQAEGKYLQSDNSADLEEAIKVTRAIPQTSSLAQKVEATIIKWRTEWNKNETYLQEAQKALDEGQWWEAIEKANQVKLLGQEVKQETSYWQNKIRPITARANELRAASNSQDGIARQSSTQEPVTQQLTTRQPAIQPSATRQSSTQESVTQQSTTRQPATQPSATRQSSTQQSSTRKSVNRQSSTRQSPAQRSTTQRSRSGSWPTDIR
jgi:hypothetical protein